LRAGAGDEGTGEAHPTLAGRVRSATRRKVAAISCSASLTAAPPDSAAPALSALSCSDILGCPEEPAIKFNPLPSRRHFLRCGITSVLGLSMPQLLAAQARLPGRPARAKNVLVILEQGGLSHIDTWDPKPSVVGEHRSPYRPIATTVPGMQF